jgi:hypothetical protein
MSFESPLLDFFDENGEARRKRFAERKKQRYEELQEESKKASIPPFPSLSGTFPPVKEDGSWAEEAKSITDLDVSCKGPLMTRETKQKLLNNWQAMQIEDILVWISGQIIEKPDMEFGGGTTGPVFYASILKESPRGGAAETLRNLGNRNTSNSSQRERKLQEIQDEANRYKREREREQENNKTSSTIPKTVIEEIQFTLAPFSSRSFRIGARCIGVPTGRGLLGNLKYSGKGLKFKNIKKEEINKMYWVQSIIQTKIQQRGSDGKNLITYRYRFCLEDSDAAPPSLMFDLQKSKDVIWANFSGDFEDLLSQMPKLQPTLESLDRQIGALSEQYQRMTDAFAAQAAELAQTKRDLLIRSGFTGTIGALTDCVLTGKWVPTDDKKSAKPDQKDLKSCIEQKLGNDVYLKALITLGEDLKKKGLEVPDYLQNLVNVSSEVLADTGPWATASGTLSKLAQSVPKPSPAPSATGAATSPTAPETEEPEED